MGVSHSFARARAPRPVKGRPPLPPQEKRSHVVDVCLNEPERARLAQLASLVGLAPAVYLRQRGLGARLPKAQAVGSADAETLDAVNKLWLSASRLRKELAPLGNNLNQLAHQANAGRTLASSLELTLSELEPLLERLRLLERETERLLSLVALGKETTR